LFPDFVPYADGRHQKRLGPAHVRDSGRRTARGAVVWWTANGPKPDADHLTPAEADTAQRGIGDHAATRGAWSEATCVVGTLST
jgi:hypothetical protein